uniref:Uncharacterized protein n=1 Tax=Enterovibrio norvegicus TaxID=188144 RepID=A0A0H4A3V1_9GAMM|nr:hypothetical protein [Enterovibrio norvegicus]
MSNWFNSIFVKKISEALAIKTPNKIPRTGEDGEKVDCYSIYVTDADGSYLASKVKGQHLHVLQWDDKNRTHNKEKLLPLESIESWNFEINHYHGLVTHNYKSARAFLLIDATGFYKFKSKLALWKYSIPKFIHSQKRLKRPTRKIALEAAIDLAKDNHNLTFDSYRLLNAMYGSYTILHPSFPTLKQGTHLVLKSLAESGELQEIDAYDFRIKGKALSTFEHLKEEQAKDDRSRRQSSMMLWLTVVLAFTAMFQSGLVKTTFFSDIDWILTIFNDCIVSVKKWIK